VQHRHQVQKRTRTDAQLADVALATHEADLSAPVRAEVARIVTAELRRVPDLWRAIVGPPWA
jgi:hypothetical protein